MGRGDRTFHEVPHVPALLPFAYVHATNSDALTSTVIWSTVSARVT